MKDEFFNKTNCDRCGEKLIVRTLSWFTEETICKNCSAIEDEIKKQLPDGGASFEGCGYVPEINEEVC
jgi:predicted nucleic acid-binding Zn ribbon protein